MSQPHHQRHVSARFSAAAHTYIAVSSLQDRVAHRVLELVPESFSAGRLLDAGCGPGRLAALARKRWPFAHITGVDIAQGMIDAARSHFAGDDRAEFKVSDIATYRAASTYDLVLSSSALHWLRPFSDGLSHVASLARPGGLVAIGLMLDGTMAELKASRDAVAPGKLAPGRLPTFFELEQAAHRINGVRVRRIEQITAEYDQESAAAVLRSVHDMGVTGGDVSRGSKPLTRTEMNALCAHYDQHYASTDGVRVTFAVGYLLLECNTNGFVPHA
jgi:malonyl-CoA O-methyltransferase